MQQCHDQPMFTLRSDRRRLREERDGAGKLHVKFPALLEWRRLRGSPAYIAGVEVDPRYGWQVWKLAMVFHVGRGRHPRGRENEGILERLMSGSSRLAAEQPRPQPH
jgi:hypothetical protein